jgi:CRISPR-associated protein Cmr1
MPRPDPGTPPELPATIPPRTDYITQTRHYRLITPLFGGGVEPGRCDPVTVVRAGEIRGHLRFWWRATRGGQFSGNLARMKEAEDALWGAAGNEQDGGPSKVEVVVHKAAQNQRGRPFIAQNPKGKEVPIGKPDSLYSYVAFPLRDTPELPVLENVAFSLTITFPKENDEDVEAALWAWETFGGIGARTRRGFGALQLCKIDGVDQSDLPVANREAVSKWLQSRLAQFTGTWPDNVPHLSSTTSFKVTQPKGNALDAWKFLIERLKNFRQPPPRSQRNWQDVDAVAQFIKQNPGQNTPLQPISIAKFQRAVFGLPIVYQNLKVRGLPEQMTLQGATKEQERLASPLILRPLACDDGKTVGVGLILQGTQLPERLVLENVQPSPEIDTQKQHDLETLQEFLDTL